MSIHRFAARRDANEPEIRKRFTHHGWHTEQVSGAGMPDLIVFLPEAMAASRPGFLVDVKDGNGKPTKVQVSKWTALRLQGIPVYVVRTEADVDALVAGTLEPWGPAKPYSKEFRTEWQETVRKAKRAPKASYTPPRSTPVDAAKEAEVFAPPLHGCYMPGCVEAFPCPKHQRPHLGKR